jgi:hypothetical protein
MFAEFMVESFYSRARRIAGYVTVSATPLSDKMADQKTANVTARSIPKLHRIFVHYKAGQGAHSELCNLFYRAVADKKTSKSGIFFAGNRLKLVQYLVCYNFAF